MEREAGASVGRETEVGGAAVSVPMAPHGHRLICKYYHAPPARLMGPGVVVPATMHLYLVGLI